MRVSYLQACLFCLVSFLLFSCASSPAGENNNSSSGTAVLTSGIFVTTNGNDANDGLSPSSPVKSIQIAVLKSVSNNLTNIYIQSGIYTPGSGLNASDCGIDIESGTNNLNFLGGCDASFTTTRSGYSELDGLFTLSNVIRALNVNNLVFDRLVVRGGMILGYSEPNNRGGGFYFYNVTDILVTNCTVSNNVAFNSGGGICIVLGQRCIISANVVGNFCTNNNGVITYGGGISINNSSSCKILGAVSNNLVSTFDTYCYGGGLYLGSGQSNYINAKICSNQSLSWGGRAGGIMIDHDYYVVITGEISRNYAYSNNSFGAGIYLSVGINSIISDTVIVGNYCRTRGGAIYMEECTNTKILNCIMTNNENDFYGVLDIYHSAAQFCGLMVSNCWIGAASNSTAIGEMLGGMGAIDVTNHVMVDNKFITNRLGQLYYDFYNTYVNIDQIYNLNSTAFTGALLTTGNVATND